MKHFLLNLENAQLPDRWPDEMPDQITLILGRLEDGVLTVDESTIPRDVYQNFRSTKLDLIRQLCPDTFFSIKLSNIPVGATITYLGEYPS